METRRFGLTGEEISLLGFGCMRLPLLQDGKTIDTVHAEEMVAYAMAHGVNYYDTAYAYHYGASEPFIGNALKKYPRETFFLATKLPTWMLECEQDVEKLFHEQLENCKVDYFDYYLVHSLNVGLVQKMQKARAYESLKRLQSQGKIRRLGISFHDAPPLLQDLVENYEWDFAQIQLNYMDWALQDSKLQYQILERKGIPVIVMEPVRGGMLHTLNAQAVEILEKADTAASPASWAIRYAAGLPGVLTVLSGMSNLAQLQDNIATMSPFRRLSQAEYDIIESALQAFLSAGTVPCTACRYCMDCPQGVDIPKIFAVYNQYMQDDSLENFQGAYSILQPNERAAACVACGICAQHCPQSIAIPGWMRKIAEKETALLQA